MMFKFTEQCRLREAIYFSGGIFFNLLNTVDIAEPYKYVFKDSVHNIFQFNSDQNVLARSAQTFRWCVYISLILFYLISFFVFFLSHELAVFICLQNE